MLRRVGFQIEKYKLPAHNRTGNRNPLKKLPTLPGKQKIKFLLVFPAAISNLAPVIFCIFEI